VVQFAEIGASDSGRRDFMTSTCGRAKKRSEHHSPGRAGSWLPQSWWC